jgi:ribosome biogenesis GTPase
VEKGLVIKSTGSWYSVRRENGTILECKLRGAFRLKETGMTNPVAVGDWVHFLIESDSNNGVITEILSRTNYIIRKSSNLSHQSQIIAANIDQAILVVTLIAPETPLPFIDRFLVSAEAYRIPVFIVFNKWDLYNSKHLEEAQHLINMYSSIGYSCLETSVPDALNLDKFKARLQDKVNVVSGKSGVGKSSLINCVDPGLEVRIKSISQAHRTGKHTTTFAEMHSLSFGGYIIDTPGIKGFGIIDMDREEIYHFFPEIFKHSENCQYYNCLHTHEPNCAVKKAVEARDIYPSRYKSYLSLLESQDKKYR